MAGVNDPCALAGADLRGSVPPGFLDASATDLHRLLPRPTLLDLPGRRAQPLFVSILLHGNEDTGLRAIQQVLRSHGDHALPRRLLLFIGNVAAARAGLRHLDEQPDYNRVWPGTREVNLPEARMLDAVTAYVAQNRPWASIDIHNNTGLNPHYACVNRLDAATLQLARLFSRIVVYFVRPLGVQSAAMASLCPAITVECGKAGTTQGDAHAAALVEAALQMDHLPAHPPRPEDLAVYHTIATVRVASERTFSFGASPAEIVFAPDIERWNFSDLDAGTPWAQVGEVDRALVVTDEAGDDVTDRYFACAHNRLVLQRPVTPAMLTRDARVIRQDCLCYLMEHHAPGAATPHPGHHG